MEWLRTTTVPTTHGLSRSMLYILIKQGLVRSVLLRPNNTTKGVRLVNKASLDAYILSFEQPQTPVAAGAPAKA